MPVFSLRVSLGAEGFDEEFWFIWVVEYSLIEVKNRLYPNVNESQSLERRRVHTAKLRCPASLADRPPPPVPAFGVSASPVCLAAVGARGQDARTARPDEEELRPDGEDSTWAVAPRADSRAHL